VRADACESDSHFGNTSRTDKFKAGCARYHLRLPDDQCAKRNVENSRDNLEDIENIVHLVG
jgi:hypothetical protein